MSPHPLVAEVPALDASAADWQGVPEHLRGGLWRYLVERVRPGDFLCAALRNDLNDAVLRAHPDLTLWDLKAVLWFLNLYAPSSAWGSPEAVEAWLAPSEEE